VYKNNFKQHKLYEMNHLVVLNDEKFAKVPLILETEEPFDKQIKFLRSLIIKKAPETKENI